MRRRRGGSRIRLTQLRLFSERVLLPDHAPARAGDGGGGFRLAAAEVVVDGHSIVAVREVPGAAWRAEREARSVTGVTDLGDRLLTPAFINGHTHLSLTCLRGVAGVESNAGNVVEEVYFPVESNLAPGDVYAFTKVAAYESLLSGVGCVFDHYYFAREVAEACASVGLSAVVCPTLQDVSGPGADAWEAQLDATASIDDDDALNERGVVAALGPHATDTVSDALWRRVADVSEARGLFWHAHLSQSFEELERSLARHGITPVERLARLGVLDTEPGALVVHGLFVAGDDVARLDGARHVIGYCPFSQLQFAFPLPLDAWREKGIPILVGTDCAAGNDTWNVQAELRLVASGAAFATTASAEHAAFRLSGSLDDAKRVHALRRGVFEERVRWAEPARLLDTVWTTPGRLHPKLPLGEIRAGARANLLIWDTAHPCFWPETDLPRALCTSDVTHAIWGLMVNGRMIGTPGDFANSLRGSQDYAAAREEASRRLKALLKRAEVKL